MSEPAEQSYEDDIVEEEVSDLSNVPSMGADGNPVDHEPLPVEDAEEESFAATPEEDRPVPRIGIHVFAEAVETGAVFEEASHDRRLAKAHITIQMGGILSAAAHFQETPTPDLVIVESLARGPELLQQLDQLAQVCDPSTKVVVIGAMNDIALYRELVRQGVSEYLVQPRSPLQVIQSIAGLYVDPSAPPVGRVITFVGAKGGVGSSTMAHNVAWCIAEEMKSETTIVDFDLAFGTAGLDFNQDPAQGVAEALAAPERLDDVLLDRLMTKCTDYLSLFAAPATLERDHDHDEAAYETVLDVMRGSVPNVIIDLPHIWTPWAKKVLLSSDHVVITATPDLASLRNSKNLFDLIKAARPNDAPPFVVLNQVGAPKRPEIPVKDFAEAMGAKPTLIEPWDAQLFGAAANNATTIIELNRKHKASEGMRRFAQIASGREFAEKSRVSPFAWLFNKR